VLENIWDNMMKVIIDDYYWPKKRKMTKDDKNSEGSKNADSPSGSNKQKNTLFQFYMLSLCHA